MTRTLNSYSSNGNDWLTQTTTSSGTSASTGEEFSGTSSTSTTSTGYDAAGAELTNATGSSQSGNTWGFEGHLTQAQTQSGTTTLSRVRSYRGA